jgi:preprotein translocase subunit SecA
MFLFGDPNKKVLKKNQPLIDRINEFEKELKELSDFDLQNRAKDLKSRVQGKIPLNLPLQKGATPSFAKEGGGGFSDSRLNEFLPEAFALVREAARRTLGQRHFDVQLMGGVVLHQRSIAEMRTGEGKTLTATLAVYLNALTGRGVHMVTVNDYLARRDAVWMGQIYAFLGLSVGCLNHMQSFIYDPVWKMETQAEQTAEDRERDQLGSFRVKADFLRPCSRKEAYAADITYGTNNEFGFDYLRDNMASSLEEQVQRGFYFAVVDEVDSILIDEARTPLIISAPAEESGELYARFARIVKTLKENDDYNLDLKMRAATLTEAGIEKVEKVLGVGNIYAEGGIKMVHHLEQALRAETLFSRDKDYVVKDDEVLIVDEFTGRLMHGRRYSEGLHQAIEAKECVKVQRENQTMASVTFQNYFRMYEKLAGMTGTAMTEAEEFSKIYNLEVVTVPTNKLAIRRDHSDRIYKNRKGKFDAVVEEIKALHQAGQPVLVGTISVEQNEEMGALLERAGVPHNILNAKNHEREAEIVAQAGKIGAVTVATNMAGRGVDIILGGAPYNAAGAEKVRALGGLAVLGTERHESRRIDNQLRGRSGRQGDPGFSRFYVSLEDELMRIFAADRIKSIMERLGLPEDMPIENGMVSGAIESAQRRVEGHNFDIRKHLLDYDDVINKHREAIYKRRSDWMKSASIKDEILDLIETEVEQVVSFHTADQDMKNWNIKEILQVANTIFTIAPETEAQLQALAQGEAGKLGAIGARDKMIHFLIELMRAEYGRLEVRLTERAGSPEILRQIEKGLSLRIIDHLWVEHLEEIDYLRTGIGLRGYAGQDPLVEYKKEAYRMWNEMMSAINKQIVYNIFKIEMTGLAPVREQNVQLSAPDKGGDAPAAGHAADKVGRNDPCPCGSGKKYKKCHGK